MLHQCYYLLHIRQNFKDYCFTLVWSGIATKCYIFINNRFIEYFIKVNAYLSRPFVIVVRYQERVCPIFYYRWRYPRGTMQDTFCMLPNILLCSYILISNWILESFGELLVQHSQLGHCWLHMWKAGTWIAKKVVSECPSKTEAFDLIQKEWDIHIIYLKLILCVEIIFPFIQDSVYFRSLTFEPVQVLYIYVWYSCIGYT